MSFDKYQVVEDVLRRFDHTIKGKSVEVLDVIPTQLVHNPVLR